MKAESLDLAMSSLDAARRKYSQAEHSNYGIEKASC